MSDHRPIEEDVREKMNVIAKFLDDALPPGYGFAFLVFKFGDDPDKRMNYISNAPREDMIAALKEFIAHSEARTMDEPEREQ